MTILRTAINLRAKGQCSRLFLAVLRISLTIGHNPVNVCVIFIGKGLVFEAGFPPSFSSKKGLCQVFLEKWSLNIRNTSL